MVFKFYWTSFSGSETLLEMPCGRRRKINWAGHRDSKKCLFLASSSFYKQSFGVILHWKKKTSTVPTLNYTSITKENNKGTCRQIECNYVGKNERPKEDSVCPFMFIAAAFSIFRVLGWSGWWRGADTSVDWLSHGRGWWDTKGRTEPHSAANCSFNNQPWSWTQPVEAKKRFYQPFD